MRHPIKIAKLIPFIILGIILLQFNDLDAQCAMCKAVATSSIENGENDIGKGLNTGILYLLAIPYLIVGCLIFFAFKKQIIAKYKSLTSK